jgi:hypothetical protein
VPLNSSGHIWIESKEWREPHGVERRFKILGMELRDRC